LTLRNRQWLKPISSLTFLGVAGYLALDLA